METKIKVSVIVPIYDVEPYLRRCLDSLVNQTLKDIEIICINDCSPDNSLLILKEYAKKDERIKIIDFDKNQGVSVARNSGIEIAKGKYIGFCDSDDYVDLDFFEKLYELAKDKNADIAKGCAKIFNINSEIFIWNNDIEFIKCPSTTFWTGIYKKSMLKKHLVKFPFNDTIICGGDQTFLYHTHIVANKIFSLNTSYYNYIVRESGSLCSMAINMKKCRSYLYCFRLALNLLNTAKKLTKSRYCYMYKRMIYGVAEWLMPRVSDAAAIEEIAAFIIYGYSKCKFPQNLNLPQNIVAAIEKKENDKLNLFFKEWIANEYFAVYPFVYIEKSILQSRKLYIWGCGKDAVLAKKSCEVKNYKIEAFLDSNPDITEFQGYKVLPPETLLNSADKNYFIVISSRKYANEIAGICEQAGLKEGVDFWRP